MNEIAVRILRRELDYTRHQLNNVSREEAELDEKLGILRRHRQELSDRIAALVETLHDAGEPEREQAKEFFPNGVIVSGEIA